MLIRNRRGWELPDSAATDETAFHNRRQLLKGLAAGPILAAGFGNVAALAADADPSAALYPAKHNDRYVLDRPAVAGVIIGARLSIAEHLADNARIFEFALEADDLAAIEPVLAKSRDLMRLIGDCGDEYR